MADILGETRRLRAGLMAPDGRYLYVSPACQDVSGYPPADFFTDAGLMEKIIHPDDAEIWAQHSPAALAPVRN